MHPTAAVRRGPKIRVVVALVAAGAAAAVAAAPAAAARRDVRVVRVSGANPLPECTTWPADADLAAMRDWDVEPALAVSPADPDHLVAAWMTGYSDGIATARSDDGGDTWTVSGLPILDCAKQHSTFDPSLAVGADAGGSGEVTYLVTDVATAQSSALATVGTYPDTGVVALTSRDGGRTWSRPVQLDRAADVDAIDGTHLATDPAHPGTAYALWSKANIYTFGRDEYVSTTVDGGRHWSAPVVLPGITGTIPIGTRLVVGPGGALAAVSASVPQAQYDMVLHQHPQTVGPTSLSVTTAPFGGTWTPRRVVATMDPARLVNVGVTSDATGRIAAAWVRVSGATVQPLVATSPDGGVTWSEPRLVGGAVDSAPFLAGADIVAPPTVVLARDGSPTVLFYDHRGDDPNGRAAGAPPRTTTVWARRLTTAGWAEDRVVGPFDGTSAPAADGTYCDGDGCAASFLGDYFGGVALRKDATGVLLVTPNPLPGSPHNSDVYFARLG